MGVWDRAEVPTKEGSTCQVLSDAASDLQQLKFLYAEGSPLLEREVIGKSQETVEFSGILFKPISGLKLPLYSQEESVRRELAIGHVPRRGERRWFPSVAQPLSLSLPSAAVSLVEDTCTLTPSSLVHRHALHP